MLIATFIFTGITFKVGVLDIAAHAFCSSFRLSFFLSKPGAVWDQQITYFFTLTCMIHIRWVSALIPSFLV